MSLENRIRDGLRHQAEDTAVSLPPVDDVFAHARRQTNKVRAVIASAILAVAVGVAAVVPGMQTRTVEFFDRSAPDDEEGPIPAAVEVPNVEGAALSSAREILGDIGLSGEPASGGGWEDPSGPDAVVVSQEPPPGTSVAAGEVVGLRTALVTPELCRVLRDLPPVRGDASDLARTDGYWEVLRRAQPIAGTPLVGYIRELLAFHGRGDPVEDAPGLAIDSVAVHHEACTE